MKPEDMNTLNEDGKAFNGNHHAVVVAVIFLGVGLLAGVVEAIKAIF